MILNTLVLISMLITILHLPAFAEILNPVLATELSDWKCSVITFPVDCIVVPAGAMPHNFDPMIGELILLPS